MTRPARDPLDRIADRAYLFVYALMLLVGCRDEIRVKAYEMELKWRARQGARFGDG